MSYNRYTPPQAEVADIPETVVGADVAPIFFSCSLLKLSVMSLCTFGLYDVYWFYKNWRYIKNRTGEDIIPAARSIFAIFFCYSLFNRIRAHQSIDASKLQAGLLAIAYVLIGLVANLPGKLSYTVIFSFVPLLFVQREINEINLASSPGHDVNSKFTAWNWAVIIIGTLLTLLVILGVPTRATRLDY